MGNSMHSETLPVNKGFLTIHQDFEKNGWKLVNNQMNFLVYNNSLQPLDDFIVAIENNKIKVSVPIAATNYLYTTIFNNYFSATEHMLTHLYNVVNYRNNKKKGESNDKDIENNTENEEFQEEV